MRKKYTYDIVKAEALKYTTRSEFRKKSNGHYDAAKRLGIYEEVCSHMVRIQKKPFSEEEIISEAKKYNTRSEFAKQSNSAYAAALRKGILDEVCSHMTLLQRKKYTLEEVVEIALNYNTRISFRKANYSAYQAALKRGVMDDICKHMHAVGNRKKRGVYIFEFPEIKTVYVGLSYNLVHRKSTHLLNSHNKGLKQLLEEKATYNYITTGKYYDAEVAAQIETDTVLDYENKNWTILNISKTGGLGGGDGTYTKEELKQEAKLYKSRSKFKEGSPNHYAAAQRRRILTSVCKHMAIKKIEPYTLDSLIKLSKNYSSISDLRKNKNGAYQAAIRLEIIDQLGFKRQTRKKITTKEIQEEAMLYKTRSEFAKQSNSAYAAAIREDILDHVCSHMTLLQRKKYTNKEIKEIALTYASRNEFKNSSRGAYAAARDRNILDAVCSHMPKRKKP